MPLKSVRVPTAFEGPFAMGEGFVERLFSQVERKPEQGTVHVGGERYVFMRCESLFVAWFSALAETFGDDAASQFIYNTAREIGRSDSVSFAERQGVGDPIARLAAGPVHFAHAGWALVEILDDSVPAPDDTFFLHYNHPNTFESEVLAARGETRESCACLFSAGYSSGWCTEAFGLELHGRELRCLAKGDSNCEFIMSPSPALDHHEQRMRQAWTTSWSDPRASSSAPSACACSRRSASSPRFRGRFSRPRPSGPGAIPPTSAVPALSASSSRWPEVSRGSTAPRRGAKPSSRSSGCCFVSDA